MRVNQEFRAFIFSHGRGESDLGPPRIHGSSWDFVSLNRRFHDGFAESRELQIPPNGG
jgi:hypothetical protein